MKLIYEIAAPNCPFTEVTRDVFYSPPQMAGTVPKQYAKRILIEATAEQIEEAHKENVS
jgi:hypothetical protein